MKRFLKTGLCLAISASVAACGVIYTPQQLPKELKADAKAPLPDLKVEIVPLTAVTAAKANATPFPRLVVLGSNTLGPGHLITVAQALNERLPQRGKPPAYKLGVGDVLKLARLIPPSVLGGANGQSTQLPIYSQSLPVSSDGYVSVLGVGRVEVEGMTTSAAEKAIAAALLRAGQDPRIELAVTGFNSKTVTISGDLAPTTTTTPVGMTVAYTNRPLRISEVLTKAGLQLTDGQDKLVRILREGVEYRMSARRLMTTIAGQDYFVRGGDVIYVSNLTYKPERVLVAGELSAPSLYTISQDARQSLLDALYATGGPTPITADSSQIYLLRRRGNDVTAFHLNAADPVRLTTAEQMELRPDDIIFVSPQPVTNFNRIVQQLFGSAPAIAQTSAGVRTAIGK